MTVKHESLMQIGALKTASGLSVKTLRYYEEVGLIQCSKRSSGGFRLFSPVVVPRLLFIKRAQTLGFSLQEIRHLLDIHDGGEPPCQTVKDGIQQKISDIDQQIQQLQTLQTELRSLIDLAPDAPERQVGVICPIIQRVKGRPMDEG